MQALKSCTGVRRFFDAPNLGCFNQFAKHFAQLGHAGLKEDDANMLLVHLRSHSAEQIKEAKQLVEAHSGSKCLSTLVGSKNDSSMTASTFFGSGSVEKIKQMCLASHYDAVIVDAEVNGIQQRNLESAWGCPVIDRVGLIIKIFAQRAHTREARLQVELAALNHQASRLVRSVDAKSGKRSTFGSGTEVVSARERGRSGMSGGLGGASGGGETELQLQKRRLGTKIKALKRKLADVRRTRNVQRQGRKRHGFPIVAVVGYTSAGKSTLISALSGQHLAACDRLFETLDPVLRRVQLPTGNSVLASDTVGFISNLPHDLITSFRATLEEVQEADLLIHVLDASSPNLATQRTAVYNVLKELNIPESQIQHRLIEVYNKIDLVDNIPDRISHSKDPLDFREDWGMNGSLTNTNEGVSQSDSMKNVDRECEKQGNQISPEEGKFGDIEDSDLDVVDKSPQSSDEDKLCKRKSLAEDAIQFLSGQASTVPSQKKEGIDLENLSTWRMIKDLQDPQESCPVALPISAVTGEGLDQLLHQIDRMVSVRSAIDRLKLQCIKAGPRILSENVKGKAIMPASLRKALPARLPLMQPLRDEHTRKLNIWQSI